MKEAVLFGMTWFDLVVLFLLWTLLHQITELRQQVSAIAQTVEAMGEKVDDLHDATKDPSEFD